MNMEQDVVEKLRVLPLERQREVLDFVEFLRQKSIPTRVRRSSMGLWADLGIDLTDEDVTAARQEMWEGFPRDIS